MKSAHTWAYNIAVGLTGLYLLSVFQRRALEGFKAVEGSPLFTDAYVITMDKYPERYPRIRANAEAAGIVLKKWPGVVVGKEDVKSLPARGIGTILFTDRTKTLFNFGVIGCFLAHRGLLEHIWKNPTGLGTFICEDDIVFPPDFYAKLSSVAQEIPDDWDFIFMRKYVIKGGPISKSIMKLEQDITSSTNMGMWGFIVKNASIPKILPFLEEMTDAVDFQLGRHADKLNMYLVNPPIIDFHESHDDSLIEKMDIEARGVGKI
jgi:GR25 family glycosyltransferase involved in LPS biosynthesis